MISTKPSRLIGPTRQMETSPRVRKQKSSTTPEPVKAESAKPAKAKGRKKRVLITLAVLGGLGLGGWYGYHWWTTGRYIESTDDAYVKADIVGLSAQVSGAVDKVPVDDNQSVDAGTILLQIDDREYRAADASGQAAIDASDATLANVREQRILQERAIDVDKADLATAKANLEFVNADFERNKTLRKRGTVSERQMQQVQTNLAAARASLAKTQAVIARDTSNCRFSIARNDKPKRNARTPWQLSVSPNSIWSGPSSVRLKPALSAIGKSSRVNMCVRACG